MRGLGRSVVLKRHRVTIRGTEGPIVVLGHGFGTDQTAWDQVVLGLKGRFRLVLFDLIGMTDESSDLYDHHRYATLHAYADDLLAILEAADIGACQYVGHSVSGMIGALAAIKAPQRFSKLVMLGASPCYTNLEGYAGGFDRKDLDGLFEAMTHSYAQWALAYAPAAVAATVGHPAVEEFSRGLLAMRPDIALSTALAIFRSDHRAALTSIPVPCTLLQTREDVAVPMGVAEFMQDSIPNAILEIIDAKGHLPHLSTPDLVRDALLRHLHPGEREKGGGENELRATRAYFAAP